MRKLFVVFKREYLQTVRKKSFVIMTILFPFLMGGMMIVPGVLASKSFSTKRVAVVDGTGRLREAFDPDKVAASLKEEVSRQAGANFTSRQGPLPKLVSVEYVAAPKDLHAAAAPYLQRLSDPRPARGAPLDAVLLIPADAFENTKASLIYYSRSATDLLGEKEISRIVNQAVSRRRLADLGIDPAVVDSALRGLPVESLQVSRGGAAKAGGKWNFLVGIVFAMLLFVPMLIYGVEIMRGIVQEKADRIMEILISSMSARQLLGGKVLGLAAVGLTQIGVWVAMGGLAAGAARGLGAMAGVNAGQFLRWSLVPYFLIFFVLGYLIYVCVYAVGGAIANSDKEAQAATTPALLILMTPWFLLMPILLNPDSRLATVISLIPLFSPITMFIRVLVSTPPFWQVALSIVLSSATIYGLFWVAAKIFRVGILSYGKRPTIPELWRWVKVA